MASSLDLVTRLSIESEYKSLYTWSLKEFKPEGEEASGTLVHRLRRRGHSEPNNVSSYQLHNPEHHESFDGV